MRITDRTAELAKEVGYDARKEGHENVLMKNGKQYPLQYQLQEFLRGKNIHIAPIPFGHKKFTLSYRYFSELKQDEIGKLELNGEIIKFDSYEEALEDGLYNGMSYYRYKREYLLN
jgi:hypothetical protein